MIENPAYLYGSYELQSPVDGALFHYTKLESFMKIIETMTLRSSPLCKMNDLNEASIDSLAWNTDFLMMIQAQKYIKELCSIICFTKNYMTGPICEEGSNHPALWAHYAEDSNGVCIVLDKEALLEINKKQLTKLFYKIEPVDYSIHLAPDDEIIKKSYDDVKDFVRSNYRGLFFRKHTDWSYEREERFFVEAPEVYLNIKGAIKYIILGGRLKNKESSLRQIIEQMITPGTLSYKYFNMHSFAEMTPSVNGYLTVDAAHVFYMQLQKMAMASSLAADWLRWHMESFT